METRGAGCAHLVLDPVCRPGTAVECTDGNAWRGAGQSATKTLKESGLERCRCGAGRAQAAIHSAGLYPWEHQARLPSRHGGWGTTAAKWGRRKKERGLHPRMLCASGPVREGRPASEAAGYRSAPGNEQVRTVPVGITTADAVPSVRGRSVPVVWLEFDHASGPASCCLFPDADALTCRATSSCHHWRRPVPVENRSASDSLRPRVTPAGAGLLCKGVFYIGPLAKVA